MDKEKANNNRNTAIDEAMRRFIDDSINQIIKICTEAILLDANNANAYIDRGGAYADKGDFNKAIEDLNTALKIDPNNNSFARERLEKIIKEIGDKK
jgi:tetratricopeptide (TPR) repeat protein